MKPAAKRNRTLWDEAKMFGRFRRGLRPFLQERLSLDACGDVLVGSFQQRDSFFLSQIRGAVYENQQSPYRCLLDWAGVEFGDLERMVRQDGVERTLEHLYDAGVHVTIDQFKGRAPILRNGLELQVSAKDFDNPVSIEHFSGTTSGSRGTPTRLAVDLRMVAQDAASHGVFLQSFGLVDSPLVLWRPQAPAPAGTKKVLMQSKLGLPSFRWFSQNKITAWNNPKAFVFARWMIMESRRFGAPIPVPEYLPLAEAGRVAELLVDLAGRGTPGHVDTNVSSGLRVCLAAEEAGLNLDGSFFRLGGEPLTALKAERIQRLGATVACHYSISEVGHIGTACADAEAIDDVHLRTDKIALIERPVVTGSGELNAFFITTLIPGGAKMLLNVGNGDFGNCSKRKCGCPFGQLGFDIHLDGVRSYEKLSTEGMHFLGTELLVLVDEVLPRHFGGGPSDYQMAEVERTDGITEVQIRVHPRLSGIDERQCSEVVVDFMRTRAPENRMMVERLVEAGTLKVVRREPYSTSSGKVLALHQTRERA